MLKGDVSSRDDEVEALRARLEALSLENATLLAFQKQPFTNILFKWFDDRSVYCFGHTCKELKQWSQAEREQRFLQVVAKGEQTKAETMLKFDPTMLLSSNAKALEYSGKIIEGVTPLQAALLGDDIDMAEMMKPYFDKLKNGQAEVEAQFKAIFEESIETYRENHKDEALDFKAVLPEIIATHRNLQEKAAFDFNEIMQAIIDAPLADVKKALEKQFDNKIVLHKALDNFRKIFEQISHKERAFNIYHFLKALAQYDEFFDRTDSSERRRLIWRQVVGWTQRFFSPAWAQATAQGVYYIVEDKEKLGRSYKFRNQSDSIFPLKAGSGVGFDSVWMRGGPGGRDARGWRCRGAAVSMLAMVSKLISGKNNRFYKLISDRRSAQKRCVIC